MFQTEGVGKIETHYMFNNFSFFFENRAVYEIVWENVVELARPYGNTADVFCMQDT
jgi:hypothetical protein